MAPPKPSSGLWAVLFEKAYKHGLLNKASCNKLQIDYIATPRYAINNRFPVAKITFEKFRPVSYSDIELPDGEMMCNFIHMIAPSSQEPDLKSRDRWAKSTIGFIERNLVRHKGPPIMGGNINDLLTLYFEKLAYRIASKKGPEGIARMNEIRSACGFDVTSVPEMTSVPSVPVPEVEFVDDRAEVPDCWDA
jgi:hypothetical protein